MRLYHKCQPAVTSPGLTLLPKLKYEHINLTSFSKMRVDLAAQVTVSPKPVSFDKDFIVGSK